MGDEIWTIKRCMDWTVDDLARRGEERPRLAAEWLLSSATGLKRIDLYLNMARPLSPAELAVMHRAVVRRREGEPLQYITGETSFRSIDVWCEPGVLIPRPETELLVELVLEHLDRAVLHMNAYERRRERVELPWNAEVDEARRAEEERLRAARAAEPVADDDGEDAAQTPEDAGEAAPAVEGQQAAFAPAEADEADAPAAPAPRSARVLEVGCGTGCISISLASERPGLVSCVAIDIDPSACDLARRNRDRYHLGTGEVDIRHGDLVAPVRADEAGTFDVLVSNPPYVPTGVLASLPAEVAHFEPRLALDGGDDGLDVFRRLVAAAPRVLRPGGLLACELFEDSLEQAAEVCRAAGFEDVSIAADLTRRPRFVMARTPRR